MFDLARLGPTRREKLGFGVALAAVVLAFAAPVLAFAGPDGGAARTARATVREAPRAPPASLALGVPDPCPCEELVVRVSAKPGRNAAARPL